MVKVLEVNVHVQGVHAITEKEVKDLETSFNSAGKGATTFGDLLKANLTSEAIIGGVKALGSAVASIGKGFVEIGKEAINGIADFEQLEGGVEKLFGDDMQGVIDNANNAYPRVILSASSRLSSSLTRVRRSTFSAILQRCFL